MAGKTTYGPDNPHPLSTLKTELVWEGKYDEYGNRRTVDIAGCSMPMQKIETIDEPRREAAAKGKQNLMAFEKAGLRKDDFRNMLIWGDNKLVMASLLKDFKGKIDLIYIDPPFDVGADFTMNVPIGDEDDAIGKDQSTLEMVAYRDMWGKGTDSYLFMMYERLSLIKELLSEEGSLWLHCDEGVSSHLRLLLDDVFSPSNFQSIVSWRRTFAGKTVGRKIPANVDNIFWFAKTDRFKYSPIYKPLDEEDIAQFTHDDVDGRGKYATVALQKVAGPTPGTKYDYKDNQGRLWKCPQKGWRMIEPKLRELENDNRLYFTKTTTTAP
jgi:adenine-specific DNA-methyltransferase